MRLPRTFHVDDDRLDAPGPIDWQFGAGEHCLDTGRREPFRHERPKQTITLNNQYARHDAAARGRPSPLRDGQ